MLVDDDVPQLVTAASRGDQGAWNAIVDRYLPLVYSVTRAYRLARSDAEDVNQTVWLRLVENLDHLREPRALPKWILTTARHECSRLTRAGRREQPVDPLTDRTLGGAVDDEVVEADLLRAEARLAPVGELNVELLAACEAMALRARRAVDEHTAFGEEALRGRARADLGDAGEEAVEPFARRRRRHGDGRAPSH